MTEDDCSGVFPSESVASSDSSITKQRKKRKWDQPAEPLVSAGFAIPGVLALGNVGTVVGIALPGVAAVSAASLISPLPADHGNVNQGFLVPSIQQHAAALVQKIQPKIQEELIAREIVINDAESSVRYKLTKRQTQDEIQKCTGAIAITRGKYRAPNAPADGEKPLYLHISAGAHLEMTAERIKAVDLAAAMVEEILKPGSMNNGLKLLSTSVFLGFEPDPALNIIARIRGPNDQYVNHIMNETGVTVLLRGRGSGNSEGGSSEGQLPLHLFLSSSNSISLEHAKLLAENLLDTICGECGASRVSSIKVYGAVPPPPQQLSVTRDSVNELKNPAAATASLISSSTTGLAPPLQASRVKFPSISTALPSAIAPQSFGMNSAPSQLHLLQPFSRGTSYNGYGGIYPQATPLQQVALALRQSALPITSAVSPAAVASSSTSSCTGSSSEKERRHSQRRKFHELPVTTKGTTKFNQMSGFLKSCELISRTIPNGDSPMPIPKSSYGMPPPPPKAMPPPPSKMNSANHFQKVNDNHVLEKSDSKVVPDTLISIMQYGDEDGDEDENIEEPTGEPAMNYLDVQSAPKPFWAV